MRHTIDLGFPGGRRAGWPVVAAALVALAACGTHRPPEMPAPSTEIRRILGRKYASPEYYEALTRLHRMGPEIDAVLVALTRNPDVNTTVRANALILLAERQSPAALGTLGRALFVEEIPVIRAAAVLGLQRLSQSTDSAVGLIRSAVGDPARSVRLNALQALDIGEVATIRALLEVEKDREVRQVAMQLVSLAESRGAPLQADRRGALRTVGGESDPHLVFRPTRSDSLAHWAVGDLRVELPIAADISLAPAAEAVAGVIPAFFSSDRSRVVFEAERTIHVLDIARRSTRTLGPGVAPRLIPFSHQFVFLRELPDGRREAGGGTEIRYEVLRAGFEEAVPERLGELTATARVDRFGNYSPVRWMVVGESAEGFVLRGEGVTTFVLPAPVWRSSPSESDDRSVGGPVGGGA